MNSAKPNATVLAIYMEHGYSGIRQQYIRPHHFDLMATDDDGRLVAQQLVIVNGSSSLAGDDTELSDNANGDILAFIDTYFDYGGATTLVASDLPSLMQYLEMDGQSVLNRMPRYRRVDINTLMTFLPEGSRPFVAGYIQGFNDFLDPSDLVKIYMHFKTVHADADMPLKIGQGRTIERATTRTSTFVVVSMGTKGVNTSTIPSND